MNQNFMHYVCAAYPVLFVRSYEEQRVLKDYVAKALSTKVFDENGNESASGYKCFEWNIVDGVRSLEIHNKQLKTGTQALEGTAAKPDAPLNFLEGAPDYSIIFVKDYHPYLKSSYEDAAFLTRKIRNLATKIKAQNKTLVFLSPEMEIPVDLEKDFTVIEYKLPEKAELLAVLKGICHSSNAVEMPSEKLTEELLDAALGMTTTEAENAFSVSLVEALKFDPEIIRREKAAIIKKTNLLEVIETTEDLDQIGGLEHAKQWTLTQKACFTPEAKAFGVRSPKGVLLMGIAGCGKSLLSKVLAVVLHRPLLRLDMSKVMDKWVGGSEGNFRRCLDTAEAVAPCVLWIS